MPTKINYDKHAPLQCLRFPINILDAIKLIKILQILYPFIYNGYTYLLNKIKNILIIDKLNIAPINLFFSVFLLLHLKNVLKKIIEATFK